jgi:hypothetical protein
LTPPIKKKPVEMALQAALEEVSLRASGFRLRVRGTTAED